MVPDEIDTSNLIISTLPDQYGEDIEITITADDQSGGLSSNSFLLEDTTTKAPAFAIAFAIVLPIPAPPPVMRATFPVKLYKSFRKIEESE